LSFYTSNYDSEEIYELPAQGEILKIPLGQPTPDLLYESKLVQIKKKMKNGQLVTN